MAGGQGCQCESGLAPPSHTHRPLALQCRSTKGKKIRLTMPHILHSELYCRLGPRWLPALRCIGTSSIAQLHLPGRRAGCYVTLTTPPHPIPSLPSPACLSQAQVILNPTNWMSIVNPLHPCPNIPCGNQPTYK